MLLKILAPMLFSIFTIFSYANFSACDLTNKDVSLAINKIIKEQPDSIFSFDGERMYLIPNRIFPTGIPKWIRNLGIWQGDALNLNQAQPAREQLNLNSSVSRRLEGN